VVVAVGIARWLLVVVLGYAAVAKTLRFALFVQTFAPLPYGRVLASGVIGCEATAAVLLASGRDLRLGAGVAVVLAGAFSCLTIASLRRPEPITCACFGSRSDQLGVSALIRNVLLVAAASVVLGASDSRLASDSATVGSTTGLALSALLVVSMYRLAVTLSTAHGVAPWRPR
jgi:hypothetical protein